MKLALAFAAALALASCGGEDNQQQQPVSAEWSAGPVIKGRQYSPGIQLATITPCCWSARISQGAELDAVLKNRGPVSGTVTLEYTVDTSGFIVTDNAAAEPILTVFFQREGDDWSARGKYAHYRWYSTKPMPLTPGTHKFTIPLTPGEWHNVNGAGSADFPAEFQQALASNGKVAIAVGHWGGRMHGITGTGAITLNQFSIN